MISELEVVRIRQALEDLAEAQHRLARAQERLVEEQHTANLIALASIPSLPPKTKNPRRRGAFVEAATRLGVNP